MSIRIDSIDCPPNMVQVFKKTPEGYLKGRAPVCTTGVYQYMDGEGKTYGELRLPEEVFHPLFLDSLKLQPLTYLHPTEKVTADNIKKYHVGTLGDNPSGPSGTEEISASGDQTGYQYFNTDMYHVSIDMIIQDAEAVAAVERGDARELSVGYTCDLEEKSGVWCGMRYDRIQRNIRANHVSIVPVARGGDSLRIRLDSADSAVLVKDSNKEATMPELKEIKLDGVSYQAEAEVLKTLNTLTVKADGLQVTLDAATAEKSKVEAERDTLKDKCDGLEKKIVDLEKSRIDEAMIKAAVDRRVKILDSARSAGVEVVDGMDEVAIQKAVIAKVFPKAVLDGKDQAYVDARYDGALETLEQNADAQNRQMGAGDSVKTDSAEDKTDGVLSVEAAKAKYIADLKASNVMTKKGA